MTSAQSTSVFLSWMLYCRISITCFPCLWKLGLPLLYILLMSVEDKGRGNVKKKTIRSRYLRLSPNDCIATMMYQAMPSNLPRARSITACLSFGLSTITLSLRSSNRLSVGHVLESWAMEVGTDASCCIAEKSEIIKGWNMRQTKLPFHWSRKRYFLAGGDLLCEKNSKSCSILLSHGNCSQDYSVSTLPPGIVDVSNEASLDGSTFWLLIRTDWPVKHIIWLVVKWLHLEGLCQNEVVVGTVGDSPLLEQCAAAILQVFKSILY